MLQKRKAKIVKRYVESKPLLPNRGLELAYARKLVGLCKPMIRETRDRVLEFYRKNKKEYAFDKSVAMDSLEDDLLFLLAEIGNKFNAEFDAEALTTAEEMVLRETDYAMRTFPQRMKFSDNQGESATQLVGLTAPYNREVPADVLKSVSQSVENEFKKGRIGESFAPGFGSSIGTMSSATVGFSIPGAVIPPDVEKAVGASIVENVSLIKSIPPQYLERVAGAVTRSMQNGGSFEDLKAEIQRCGNMTERRAYNIALDQTRKVFDAITLRQMQKSGIKKFRWHHTAGSVRQREFHLHKYPIGLNGGIFSLDDPPIIDQRYGTRGFPGQLPYCRCYMSAVIEVDGAEY